LTKPFARLGGLNNFRDEVKMLNTRFLSLLKRRWSAASRLALLPLLGALPGGLSAASPATAMPAIIRAQANAPSPPLCYIERLGQLQQSLDKLCGVGFAAASRKLSLYGPDGKPSPALIAAVKRMQQQSMNSADPEGGVKALRDFVAQMPLSPNAQALLNQTADLIQQMGRSGGKSDELGIKVYEQLDAMNQKLKQDPSYVAVDKAVHEAMEY
jgi:hypothetical protein